MESMKKATAKKPHLGLPESALALGNALVISQAAEAWHSSRSIPEWFSFIEVKEKQTRYGNMAG